MPNYINNNVYHVYSTLNVSVWYSVCCVRIDSAALCRHRHNLIIVTTPLSRRELSVMGAASVSSLDQLLTVQLARDVDAESAKC